MPVPFLDLSHTTNPIRDSFLQELDAILSSNLFVNGPQVAEFEAAFARYVGCKHCVGVASGLDALRLGFEALGIAKGDEVLVPAMTFIATWEAVTQAGGVPVPVDVSAHDFCLDPGALAAAISPRTRFVLPVHLYGQSANTRKILEIAEPRGLVMVEDAAQAHGARRSGVRTGSSGALSAFSFYPGKNLGAMGDAGAVVTNDARIAETVRALREHGQRRKYEHDRVGWTARLDTIQAAALLHKLPFLDGWNESRRRIATRYSEQLEGVGDLALPTLASDSESVWHLYVARTADPDALAAALLERGISTGRHYPIPPHRTTAYEHLGYAPGSFPVAEELAASCISLPIFPGMTEAQVEEVIDAVGGWFADG